MALAKVGAKVGHVLQPHRQPVPAWGTGAAPCPTELTRTVLKLCLALYSLAVLEEMYVYEEKGEHDQQPAFVGGILSELHSFILGAGGRERILDFLFPVGSLWECPISHLNLKVLSGVF